MTAAKHAPSKVEGKATAKSSNFSADFKELEDIVRWFEANEVDLEEGLKKFEHGLALAKKCRTRIQEVENKVTQIKAKFDAVTEEEDSASGPQASLL